MKMTSTYIILLIYASLALMKMATSTLQLADAISLFIVASFAVYMLQFNKVRQTPSEKELQALKTKLSAVNLEKIFKKD